MNPHDRVAKREMTPKPEYAGLLERYPEGLVQFHVRDIENRRSAGDYRSMTEALDSLRGSPDGRYSINNHHGDWCEVEIRGGERFVRSVLMVDGTPATFSNIDLGG